MNFIAYAKKSGVYEAMPGKAVFTFSSSKLFDERLDEAFLNITASAVETYKPTTEIKVVLDDGTNTTEKYYIISSDRSQEMPNGSGKYNHEIHLLERTKLLEGIYCQTLTFTNSKGNVYIKTDEYATPSSSNIGQDIPGSTVFNSLITSYITTRPILPSANEVADRIRAIYNTNGTYAVVAQENGNNPVITVENANGDVEAQTYLLNASISGKKISSGTTTITYNFKVFVTPQGGTASEITYIVTYTVPAIDNHYPLKPWTITDCVNRCLDLAEPLYGDDSGQTPQIDTPRYTFNEEQAQKYADVIAPEFSMTQCTLREQMKLIGGYIHAEPRLGGFVNGVYQENVIFFDEYGKGNNAQIENEPYIYKAFSHDINEYCTHIETSASNVINSLNLGQGTVTEPNANNNRTVRTDSVNVMLSDSNSYASTDNAIYDVKRVLVTLYQADGTVFNPFKDVDITDYIFEWHEYNRLSSYTGTYPYAKAYALYYTRGEKGIKGLFFKEEKAILEDFENYALYNILSKVTGESISAIDVISFARIAFNITYTPIYDTKFSHSKQTVEIGAKPFMRVYNQSENTIESKSYGEHIKGVAQRLGNVEQVRTYILKDITLIPNVGETIDGYVISEVKAEVQQGFIKCQVALTKDFNRISQYIGINSQKRVYEVSERNTLKRDVLLRNYIVISRNGVPSLNKDRAFLKHITPIAQIFNSAITDAIDKPINAVECLGMDKNFGVIESTNVYLPVISSSFGNSMVFSWRYKDNYSAGEEVEPSAKDNITSWWQQDVACGDYYGRIYWYTFDLLSNPTDGGFAQATTPTVKNATAQENIYSSPYYKLRKDNREMLSINYQIEYVTTDDNLVIGSALASSCPLVSRQEESAPRLVLYTRPVGKFEDNARNLASDEFAELGAGYYSVSVENDVLTISFTVPSAYTSEDLKNIKSFAFITPSRTETKQYEDEDGNVVEITRQTGDKIMLAQNFPNGMDARTQTITMQITDTIYER